MEMNRPRIRPRPPLFATAAAGATGFATISALVARERTQHADASVREWIGTQHDPRVRAVVRVLGYSGKSWVHGPVAALVAQYLEHQGSLEGARAVKFSSTLASTASSTFDWLLQHRIPPPGRHSRRAQSFPSGHTLETAAVALTSAYVLWREGLAGGRIVFPVAAAITLLQGGGRLYLDRHWLTDVAAGLLGGIAVAAACSAGYETRVA